MELERISFNALESGKECLFRTDNQRIVHAIKEGLDRVLNRATGERAITGRYHEVWQIDPLKHEGPERRPCPPAGPPLSTKA